MTVTTIHICTFGAQRGLCGGVLAPLTDVTIAGRRTRTDAAELLDPSDDTTWSACTLEDVELEIGFLASLPSAAERARVCSSCVGHLVRMRATARPPVRHIQLAGGIARCGRSIGIGLISTGTITGRMPGVLAAAIDCPTCVLRAEQQEARERERAVQQAKRAEKKQTRELARMRQRVPIETVDRAFAWLDEDDGDDLRFN